MNFLKQCEDCLLQAISKANLVLPEANLSEIIDSLSWYLSHCAQDPLMLVDYLRTIPEKKQKMIPVIVSKVISALEQTGWTNNQDKTIAKELASRLRNSLHLLEIVSSEVFIQKLKLSANLAIQSRNAKLGKGQEILFANLTKELSSAVERIIGHEEGPGLAFLRFVLEIASMSSEMARMKDFETKMLSIEYLPKLAEIEHWVRRKIPYKHSPEGYYNFGIELKLDLDGLNMNQIINKEFIDELAKEIRKLKVTTKAKVVEICAGSGKLSFHLRKRGINAVATDDYSSPKSGGPYVLRYDYRQALLHFKPEIVLASWILPEEPVGFDVLSYPSVKYFILIEEQEEPIRGESQSPYAACDASAYQKAIENLNVAGHRVQFAKWRDLEKVFAYSFCNNDFAGDPRHSRVVLFTKWHWH